MKEVYIFCDGACSGNPGIGAYGAILKYKNVSKEIFNAFELTTNNRMELLGAIDALKLLKEKCIVHVYSDSQYLVKGMTVWIEKWKKNNWKTSSKKNVMNQDLWEQLDYLCSIHQVDFNWIKGHNNHPENERCDTLAREAILNFKLTNG